VHLSDAVGILLRVAVMIPKTWTWKPDLRYFVREAVVFFMRRMCWEEVMERVVSLHFSRWHLVFLLFFLRACTITVFFVL